MRTTSPRELRKSTGGRPAATNTSAGAPLAICWARACDPPKLKTTRAPVSPSYRSPISSIASARLAAANTSTSSSGWAHAVSSGNTSAMAPTRISFNGLTSLAGR